MAWLGESWEIDDTLVFTVNTHTPGTGAATDADAVPAYRVYEDETPTAILTNSMAKLDDASTTGFYSEQLSLTAANGFEAGKSYSIYISAAVGSVTGTISHNFRMAPALAELGVAAPSATPTAKKALMLLYMWLRNKKTVTSTTLAVFNDAGTQIASKALSDDGTTYTEAEMS